jgi:A/G-specific adenine glycosylase
MLQQTQAARVAPAFRRFIRRFPSLRALASAPRGDVLRAWAGLGYNRRAVALANAARVIARDHRGRVPGDPELLQRLPGVGPYTAAAVASLGYGLPVPALDVNIRRVVARARLGAEDSKVPGRAVREAAWRWIDRRRPGDWNQALMDLGREVCRPIPRCSGCPLAARCGFRIAGRPPSPPQRRQPGFDGSFRQLRGRILAVLRDRGTATLGRLEERTGASRERVAAAAAALAADGLVVAGPAALAGRPMGRIRLPAD